jgi:hypothetical protein
MGEELIERGREFARSMEGAGGKHLVSALCDALEAAEKAHTPTDDEREALTYLITAFRFRERGLRGVAMEPDLAVSRPLAEFLHAEGFHLSDVPEPSDARYAEFENWEQEMFRHQPVLSMADGSIAGCQCLDRVFVNGREDWGTHLASVITARLPEPQGEPSDAINIPRPHVPYGPIGIPEHMADADYLDHAAASLEGHYEVGGSNVRATVVKLLRDTAAALRAASAVTEPMSLDPQPWVFVSDQVFGVRSATDKGFHSVSGTYYVFQPRREYEQDRARYESAGGVR